MSAVIHEFSPAQVRDDYPQPQAILGQYDEKPYPLDALPDLMRDAVQEVQAYVQAPTALIACNALAVASLATQGLAKIRRDIQLVSPLSLYVFLISEPNERKTFSEGFFTAGVKAWEREQLAKYKPEYDKYQADLAAWQASCKGITLDIQKLAKNGETSEIDKRRKDLQDLAKDKPESPLVPRLIFMDTTYQSVADKLVKSLTSGILTSEGGAFFGGASFQADQIIGALSFYNEMWSGSSVAIDRKGEGSSLLSDVALMMNVAVQPEVLQKFLTRTGSLARGSGFLARPLLAMPDTTQGQRPYKEPPANGFPAVEQFNERIKTLLGLQPEHITERRRLKRTTLELSASAKAVWVRYYNATEQAQGVGGDAEFIRSEAGKSADNASRIAAIFHVIEHGLDGEVSRDNMVRGCKLAEWHLHEARRFLALTDTPTQFNQAEQLSKRMVAHCRKHKGKGEDWNTLTARDVLRHCKVAGVQDTKTLNPVLTELMDAHHILGVKQVGNSRVIFVNPRLLEVNP